MEVESKYIAPRSDAFVALMQAPELAGLHLEPLPPAHLVDVYLDTEAADLLRRGYAFRIREQEGEVLATLKAVGGADGAVHRRLELEAALGGPLEDGRLPQLPPGPLREALAELAGDAPLQELTRLQQYRTPRVAFDGARLVGVLSLDVVAHAVEGGPHVTNEVEVELAEGGREEDLYRLDPVLRARGLEPTARSKFERAILRLRRGPDAPLLLLPDERVALDAFAEDGTPLHRRRARVVLLAARALHTETIANKVGLSPSRVRHWVDTFRERRMDIFESGPERSTPLLSRQSPPSFRVSELVTAGTLTPSLFRHEHFDDDGAGLEGETRAHPTRGDWAGRHAERAPAIRTREESVEFERVPVEPSAAGTAGDGAPIRAPGPPSPAAPRPPDGSARPPAQAGGVPPVSLDRLVPEDVASLDELLDLFEGAPVTTPRIGRDHETVGISLIEDEPDSAPDVSAFTAPLDVERPVAPPGPTEPQTRRAEGGSILPADPGARARRSSTGARPTFDAEEPVLVAAERVLRHARDYLAGAASRLADERDAVAVRRALVAAHRVRIGLELFEDYLPVRSVRRLHRGLRPAAHALDALADLDFLSDQLSSAHDEAAPPDRPSFAPALDAFSNRREEALNGALALLEGGAHALWLARFDRLLDHITAQAEAGLDVGRPDGFDDYVDVVQERPARALVHHMLGSALWTRYESLRAYDPVVTSANTEGEALLYPMGVACAALQYLLGLASGCSGPDARTPSDALAAVERRLVTFHHARAAAAALRPYTQSPPVQALQRRLEALADGARAEVPTHWADVTAPSFREALARVLVGIGGR